MATIEPRTRDAASSDRRESVIRFELSEEFSSGKADAYLVARNAAGDDIETTTHVAEVWDAFDMFSDDGDVGHKGYARFMPDMNRFEVFQLVCPDS